MMGDRSVPDDLAVNSAGDAVLKLQVHLGDGVLGEDGGIGDITWESGMLVRCTSRLLTCFEDFSFWFRFSA